MTQSPFDPQQPQPSYGQPQPGYGQPQTPPGTQTPPGYQSAPPPQYQAPTQYGSQYQPYAGADTTTVGGDQTIALWWQRLLAYIIDAIVLGIIAVILRAIISPKGTGGTYLLTVILSVIAFAYYGGQHALWGQTLGKRALGTMVVTADARGKISGRTAAIRAAIFGLAPIVYIAGSLFTVVDALWLTWDPRRQALHDKAAKTLVVRKDSLGGNPYQQ